MNHAAQVPSWGAIFKAQLRHTLGARRHVGWLLLALLAVQIVVLGGTGVVFGVKLTPAAEGGSTTSASPAGVSHFDDFGFGSHIDQGLAALWLAGLTSLLWAAFWPGRVWSGETASNRGYHWAMPIRSNHHDLTRVLAGGVWVAAVSAALVLVAVITAATFGHATLFPRLTPWFWLNLLVAPILVYALASTVYVRAKSLPFAWFWGVVLGLGILLNALAEWAPGVISSVVRPLASGNLGLVRILFFPLFGEISGQSVTAASSQVPGWILWIAIVGAGLWLAASLRTKD